MHPVFTHAFDEPVEDTVHALSVWRREVGWRTACSGPGAGGLMCRPELPTENLSAVIRKGVGEVALTAHADEAVA